MKSQIILFALLLISLLLTNCTKDESGPDFILINEGSFQYQSNEYHTVNAAFNNSNVSDTLYFYSDNILFSAYYYNFTGHGDMVKLNLSNPIFSSDDPYLDNFKGENSFEVSGGTVYIGYSMDKVIGTVYNVQSGVLKTDVVDGYYNFKYELELADGTVITGNYTGGLIVF